MVEFVEHFSEQFLQRSGQAKPRWRSDALQLLRDYPWPGNVRELKNTIERVVIMNPAVKVAAGDLPAHGKEEPPAASFRFPSFKEATDAYHREFIQRKLEEAEGNVSRAAELMGVDRSHLYRRMRALGIQNRAERLA